jgi:hypothetical protein
MRAQLRRRDRVHPAFLDARGLDAGLEVLDIALDRLLSHVLDRAFDQGAVRGHELLGQPAPGVRVHVGLLELGHVPALGPIADHEILGGHRRFGVHRQRGHPQPGVGDLYA